VSAVLLPLGLWLAVTRPGRADSNARSVRVIPQPILILLAAGVGCVGGIYGIGGGSILAPILIGTGRPPSEVAPAALASTFVTSVAGVVTFTILSIHQHGRLLPTGRRASRSASAAWRALIPVPGCNPACLTPSSAALSAFSSSRSASAIYGLV
jgi:hypothetical protein